MSSGITFVEIPADLHPILGTPKPATRHYQRKGTQEEVGHWYDALSRTVGPTVSPGGVRMFVPVTRAAIHERVRRGRLSLFEFQVESRGMNLFGQSTDVQDRPYTYVPVNECRQWRKEVETRAVAKGISQEAIDEAKPDWLEDFIETMDGEDEQTLKGRPATLEVPISQYELNRATKLAQALGYETPGAAVAAFLRPIIQAGFSGLSFAKAGWWMSGQLEKHGVAETPLPKFIKKLTRGKS